MAFENINVESLKSVLLSCKNNLNHDASKNLIDKISNLNTWQSGAQKKLKDALVKFNNEKYKALELKIDIYLIISNMIEKYQTLERENIILDNNYSALNKELYYTEYYKEYVNDNGKSVEVTRSREVKNYSVENKMRENRIKYNDNKTIMNITKNNIENSI